MKKNLASVWTFTVLTVLLSGFVFAQDGNRTIPVTSDLYMISAKAGGVNYVEGNVALNSKNKKSGYLLKGDALQIGDKVSTGADGKAEILLNPGSYVRLAENSGFEFLTTSLDDLQLKLNSGSAMFEIITADEFNVVVNTPKSRFLINTSGVYRVDVTNDGGGKIAVWKGKANIGDVNATEIKGGREATVNGNQIAIAKFDRDEKDALEIWSKTRAKDLARINSRLQRPALRNALLSGFNSRWNMYNSFGLWIFDASYGSYCFLPFGYGWNSPYGYGYGRDLYYFQLPRVIYTQPPTGNGGGTVVAGKSRIRQTIEPSMPYERVQEKAGRARFDPNMEGSQFPSAQPSSSGAGAPPAVTRPASKGQRANQ